MFFYNRSPLLKISTVNTKISAHMYNHIIKFTLLRLSLLHIALEAIYWLC